MGGMQTSSSHEASCTLPLSPGGAELPPRNPTRREVSTALPNNGFPTRSFARGGVTPKRRVKRLIYRFAFVLGLCIFFLCFLPKNHMSSPKNYLTYSNE